MINTLKILFSLILCLGSFFLSTAQTYMELNHLIETDYGKWEYLKVNLNEYRTEITVRFIASTDSWIESDLDEYLMSSKGNIYPILHSDISGSRSHQIISAGDTVLIKEIFPSVMGDNGVITYYSPEKTNLFFTAPRNPSTIINISHCKKILTDAKNLSIKGYEESALKHIDYVIANKGGKSLDICKRINSIISHILDNTSTLNSKRLYNLCEQIVKISEHIDYSDYNNINKAYRICAISSINNDEDYNQAVKYCIKALTPYIDGRIFLDNKFSDTFRLLCYSSIENRQFQELEDVMDTFIELYSNLKNCNKSVLFNVISEYEIVCKYSDNYSPIYRLLNIESYENKLSNLNNHYYSFALGAYQNEAYDICIEYGTNALTEHIERELIPEIDYAIANSFLKIGDFVNGNKWYEQFALDIYRYNCTAFLRKSFVYKCSDAIGYFYNNKLYDSQFAVERFLTSNIFNKVGNNNWPFVIFAHNASSRYAEIYDYNSALYWQKKAFQGISQLVQRNSEFSTDLIGSARNLALINHHMSNDIAANKYLDIATTYSNPDSLEYSLLLIDKAILEINNNKFNLENIKQVIRYCMDQQNNLTADEQQILKSKLTPLEAYLDFFNGEYESACKKFEISNLNLQKICCEIRMNNVDGAIISIIDYVNYLKGDASRVFLYYSEKQKNSYINGISKILDLLSSVLIAMGDKRCPSVLYNIALFRKSILLQSSNDLTDFVYNSNNPDVIEIYEKINSIQKSIMQFDEAQQTAIRLELEELSLMLSREILKYGNYISRLFFTWEQVRNAIGENDIVIEFIQTKPVKDLMFESSDNMIYALVLSKEFDSPILINCISYTDLMNLCNHEDELYISSQNATTLYNTLWSYLGQYLKEETNIFFSPVGKLNILNIESIPDSNGIPLNKKAKLHRLTSTREIMRRKPREHLHSIVLYGDLNYDANFNPIADGEYVMGKDMSNGRLSNALLHKISTRGTKKALPWTKVEIDSIEFLLKQLLPFNVQKFTRSGGTEDSFNALTNTDTNILHLATHGFYYSESDAHNEIQSLPFVSFSKNHWDYYEDTSLTRSGLFLSCANNSLRGTKVPFGVEDGILTSLEISALRFPKLDLVVLSACETGLGDITDEGIWGLQRGFKKAGAHSILMSLWEVDDEATQILMIEFYKNYLSGMSKRESLLAAQKAVRETPGFDDPEYWAAFILLDGLN